MRHEVVSLSDGWRGTDQTVERIMQLVDDSLTDPLVVTTAQNLVRNLPERDRMAELRAVSAFVRSKFRYTNEGIETLKTPRLLMDEIRKYGKAVGDCDDSVILWMALLKALGHKVRAVVVSQRQDKAATHIYAEDFINGRWVSDDTIVKYKPMGWSVPAREKTATKQYAAMSGVTPLVDCVKRGKEFIRQHGGNEMRDYLQVGNAVTQWERKEDSPFAKFTIYGSPRRAQAVSDFLPKKTYFGGSQVRPFVNVKLGGMIEVNEWGMGEAIGIIPGSGVDGLGKSKLLKRVQKIAAKVAPKIVKALPFVAAGGVIATIAAKAAKAAAAKKKASSESQPAPDVVPGSTPVGPQPPTTVTTTPEDQGGDQGGDQGTTYAPPAGQPTPSSAATTTTVPGTRTRAPKSDNTMLYVGLGGAALLAIILMGRK